MGALSKKDKTRFLSTLDRIADERVRYFYMMLGDAMADFAPRTSRSHRLANTSPSHIDDLRRCISD